MQESDVKRGRGGIIVEDPRIRDDHEDDDDDYDDDECDAMNIDNRNVKIPGWTTRLDCMRACECVWQCIQYRRVRMTEGCT